MDLYLKWKNKFSDIVLNSTLIISMYSLIYNLYFKYLLRIQNILFVLFSMILNKIPFIMVFKHDSP